MSANLEGRGGPYSPRACLQNCPPEVLEPICRLACAGDDGSTARSLSCVSRYLSEVSRPLRYQNVAINGVKQLKRFSSVVKEYPNVCRVRSLFFSSHHLPRKCVFPAPDDKPARSWGTRIRKPIFSSSQVTGHHSGYWPENITQTDKQTIRNIHLYLFHIFTKVAGTLESLTLVLPNPWNIPFPRADAPLNMLVEFSVYAICESKVDPWMEPLGIPVVLPALQRLHLVGRYFNPPSTLKFITRAPSLTHLRFSGLEYSRGSQTVLLELLRTRAIRRSPQHSCPFECFLIQARPLIYGRDFPYNTTKSTPLHGLHSSVDGRPRIVPLNMQIWSGTADEVIDEAKSCWIGRNEGGLGCWDESDVMNGILLEPIERRGWYFAAAGSVA
ncbi:hypothetical protein JAAARDRAFT_63799 [Jaapia argillacea MUCL 33604]|uniref:F-box domain-containing protein n=1 Tax=Jaapia argillacea MUCL 33604 TaxID=933084 RepID=A0A067PFG0_9AGAM|nr:hypothetical protein JAAARDRAFT_63799 [Jaapia argillacea MUCL 33604]